MGLCTCIYIHASVRVHGCQIMCEYMNAYTSVTVCVCVYTAHYNNEDLPDIPLFPFFNVTPSFPHKANSFYLSWFSITGLREIMEGGRLS